MGAMQNQTLMGNQSFDMGFPNSFSGAQQDSAAVNGLARHTANKNSNSPATNAGGVPTTAMSNGNMTGNKGTPFNDLEKLMMSELIFSNEADMEDAVSDEDGMEMELYNQGFLAV